MKRKPIILFLAVLMAFAIAASAQAMDTDGAGNAISGEPELSSVQTERDLYWAGEALNLRDAVLGADAVLAGRDLTINGATLGGSLRAAGYNLYLNGVQAQNNFTCAGYNIVFDKNCSAHGAYAVGYEINFDGVCDTLCAAGTTVTINGTVNGDASVVADKIFIGENAVIMGTLKTESGSNPVVASGAQIAQSDYNVVEETEEVTEAVVGTAIIAHKLLSRLYWIPATALLALFICLCINRSLENAKDMIKYRTAPMLITGAIAMLAMPMLLLLVCLTYIGLPLAGLLALLYLLVFLFAIPFTGASLARLVFPNMNVYLAALVGGAILSAARIIPVLRTILYFACVIYTLGYFVLACYDGIKNNGKRQPVMQNPDMTQPVFEGSQQLTKAPSEGEKPELQPRNEENKQ